MPKKNTYKTRGICVSISFDIKCLLFSVYGKTNNYRESGIHLNTSNNNCLLPEMATTKNKPRCPNSGVPAQEFPESWEFLKNPNSGNLIMPRCPNFGVPALEFPESWEFLKNPNSGNLIMPRCPNSGVPALELPESRLTVSPNLCSELSDTLQ